MADDALRLAYQEVCSSYHGITEFRAKLLALLPIASGGGIFLLLSTKGETEVFGPIGLFGLLSTFGLFSYELRQIGRCKELIRTGRRLEEVLGVEGQFRTRPGHPLGFIGSEFAGWTVYATVLLGWGYLANLGYDAVAYEWIVYAALAVWGAYIAWGFVPWAIESTRRKLGRSASPRPQSP